MGSPLTCLVEARGVEPLSENLFTRLSTSVVCLWGSPAAFRQTGGAGRYSLVHLDSRETLNRRAPLIDAPFRAVVLPKGTVTVN